MASTDERPRAGRSAADLARQLEEQIRMQREAMGAVPAPPPAEEVPIIILTSRQRGPITFIVVGAGGTGARVVAPLSQMLRRGDALAIVDHDIVEDRNIIRQHFSARDIGMPKAVVLAERYRKPHARVVAFQQRLPEDLPSVQVLARAIHAAITEGDVGTPRHAIIIGCVDAAAGRRGCRQLLELTPYLGADQGAAWIDLGNEMRGGQALLSLRQWPMHVSRLGGDYPITMAGLAEAMPQLLRSAPGADAEVSCGERIDLQTVQVNALAASVGINMAAQLMLGLPITSAGTFFSTLNTMQPIALASVSLGRSGAVDVHPSSAFALAEGAA